MQSVVIATGGTGGHIFPAEVLAEELIAKGYDVTFVGGGLKTNRYFHRHQFKYEEVSCCQLAQFFRFCYLTARGILQSIRILTKLNPKLVIGFGSFYTFPVLIAAKLKKIPFLLFESNAVPGKVNRFFSKWALLSAVQFRDAEKYLQGKVVEVKMPIIKVSSDAKSAREYFYLKPDTFTFLVFGGSQGAESINHLFSEAACHLKENFQVIHVTGQAESVERLRRFYVTSGISACVKAFEKRMDLAWSAATAAVCRAGAATVGEQIAYAVPAILIPFPKATDDHQTKNARVIQENIKGGLMCSEETLTAPHLSLLLTQMLSCEGQEEMRRSLIAFSQDRQNLAELVGELCRIIS